MFNLEVRRSPIQGWEGWGFDRWGSPGEEGALWVFGGAVGHHGERGVLIQVGGGSGPCHRSLETLLVLLSLFDHRRPALRRPCSFPFWWRLFC